MRGGDNQVEQLHPCDCGAASGGQHRVGDRFHYLKTEGEGGYKVE